MAIINIGLKKGLAANIDYNQRYNAYLADRQLAMQQERINIEKFKIMQEALQPFSGDLTKAGNVKYAKLMEDISKKIGELHVQSNGDIFSDPESAMKFAEYSAQVKNNPIIREEMAFKTNLANFYNYMNKNQHMIVTPKARDLMEQFEDWKDNPDRGAVPEYLPEYERPMQEIFKDKYQNIERPVYDASMGAYVYEYDPEQLANALEDFSSPSFEGFMQNAGRFKLSHPQYMDLTTDELVSTPEWKEWANAQFMLQYKGDKSITKDLRQVTTKSDKIDPNVPTITDAKEVTSVQMLLGGRWIGGIDVNKIYGSKVNGLDVAKEEFVSNMTVGNRKLRDIASYGSVVLMPTSKIKSNDNDKRNIDIDGQFYISNDDYQKIINPQDKLLFRQATLIDTGKIIFGEGIGLATGTKVYVGNYTATAPMDQFALATQLAEMASPGTSREARVSRENFIRTFVDLFTPSAVPIRSTTPTNTPPSQTTGSRTPGS